MKLNSKLAVVGAPLLGVLATGLTLSASAHSATGATSMTEIFLGSVPDGEETDEAREMDLRDVMPMAHLSLTQAIDAALAVQPGAAVEAGIEGEFGEGDEVAVFYEVMIVGADQKLHEVKVSHLNGTVLEDSIEDDEEETRELIGFNEALRHSELTLTQMIASAGKLVNGRAASASLEVDDEGPECEVLMVSGRYIVGVDIEARAGHIVEVELAGTGRDDNEYSHRDGDDDGDSWDEDDDEDDD